MHSHSDCKVLTVQINGRTLRQSLDTTKANHRFGKFSLTEWIDVCPKCDAYGLGGEFTHPWPFLCADGVMRTVNDFNVELDKFTSHDFDFQGFKFSESALESAITICQLEDPTTESVEEAGAKINTTSNASELLKFSQLVCEWGRGQRVWANLQKHNSDTELFNAYSDWFKFAEDATDEGSSIEPGIKIKGLGVSFASKHLRMLNPEKFAVLDEVISEGLGFALNRNGYRLFMRCLQEFSNFNKIKHNLSKLESGIFILVRQQVRSE